MLELRSPVRSVESADCRPGTIFHLEITSKRGLPGVFLYSFPGAKQFLAAVSGLADRLNCDVMI